MSSNSITYIIQIHKATDSTLNNHEFLKRLAMTNLITFPRKQSRLLRIFLLLDHLLMQLHQLWDNQTLNFNAIASTIHGARLLRVGVCV